MAMLIWGAGARSRPSPTVERLTDIARRCGDLSPIREPVRRILWEGNKERALAGVDPQGRKYAPLSIYTLRNRAGFGPPLAPREANSRVVTMYTVKVDAGVSRLSFTGSWPGLRWMEYHQTGTRRMPARPVYGFRKVDLDLIRAILADHVVKRKGWFR